MLTGMSRTRIYELIKNGQIQAVKVGCTTLIPFATLRAYIERLQSSNLRL